MRREVRTQHTASPVAYFLSVAMAAPVRLAWFRAALPLTTVSREEAPPLALLPILVTDSQSSILKACKELVVGLAMYLKIVMGGSSL